MSKESTSQLRGVLFLYLNTQEQHADISRIRYNDTWLNVLLLFIIDEALEARSKRDGKIVDLEKKKKLKVTALEHLEPLAAMLHASPVCIKLKHPLA